MVYSHSCSVSGARQPVVRVFPEVWNILYNGAHECTNIYKTVGLGGNIPSFDGADDTFIVCTMTVCVYLPLRPILYCRTDDWLFWCFNLPSEVDITSFTISSTAPHHRIKIFIYSADRFSKHLGLSFNGAVLPQFVVLYASSLLRTKKRYGSKVLAVHPHGHYRLLCYITSSKISDQQHHCCRGLLLSAVFC